MEILRHSTDSDSVGSAICERASKLGAALVVLSKHNKGALKEFFVGSVTNYCESIDIMGFTGAGAWAVIACAIREPCWQG